MREREINHEREERDENEKEIMGERGERLPSPSQEGERQRNYFPSPLFLPLPRRREVRERTRRRGERTLPYACTHARGREQEKISPPHARMPARARRQERGEGERNRERERDFLFSFSLFSLINFSSKK